MTLVINAHIHAVAEKRDLVIAELNLLLAPTRAEKGCIAYILHQDNLDPNHFMFHEQWESRKDWQDHMNGPALQRWSEKTDGAVAEFTLYEMTEIG
jgi:quinol monooxygenase YgiN